MIPLHLQIARNLVGMQEIGNNEGFTNKEFETYIHDNFGWRKGYSWCAYFVGFCLDVAKAKQPVYRGSLARGFFYKGYNTFKDTSLLEAGDIIVWIKENGINGHVGIINKVIDAQTVETIEGNTSNGDKGSQDNGDGCYIRTRKLNFTSKTFKVIGFSKVSYDVA